MSISKQLGLRKAGQKSTQLLRLFYCDHHEIPLPPEHKFPIQKYLLVRELLAADRIFEFEAAAFATSSEAHMFNCIAEEGSRRNNR